MSSEEPGEIQAQGSVVSGKVDVTDGDFVGRDKFVGLNIDDFITALKQAFPSGDTRPERLHQLLNEFREYHAKLYEWKELHNALNRIIDAFDQYGTQVDNTYKSSPHKPSVYRETWRPVDRGVNDMLAWAQTIQHIGTCYRELANNQLEGERWAMDIKGRRDDLMAHFRTGTAVEKSMSGIVVTRLLQASLITAWLRQLHGLTHDFNDAIKQHMSQADSQLRVTATDLYILSTQAFGNQT